MKNYIRLALLTLTLTISAISFAQEFPKIEAPARSGSEHITRNIFKTNLFSYAFRNYDFHVERVLTRRFTLGLDYRLMPNGHVPLMSLISDQIGDDSPELQDMLNSTRLQGRAITPEVRWYPSRKGYGKGFYMGVNYRSVMYKMDGADVEFGGENLRMSGEFNSSSVGLSIGKQWTIARYVTIDWMFLGFQYGNCNGTFRGEFDRTLTPDERETVEGSINSLEIDLPVIGDNFRLNKSVGSNQATILMYSPFAMVRTSLSIGIRF